MMLNPQEREREWHVSFPFPLAYGKLLLPFSAFKGTPPVVLGLSWRTGTP